MECVITPLYTGSAKQVKKRDGGLTSNPFFSIIHIELGGSMSLLSQRDRQLAITAINHYIDFLSSEVEFLEKEDMLDDPDYQEYKSELTESYALVNWVKLEYQKNEN